MSKREPKPPGALTPPEFAAQFRASSRVLWCVAAGVLGDRAQAEDVLQEAALTALGKLHSFRSGSNFVAWMSQIVRFVALNHRRKHDRRERMLRATGGDPLIADSTPADVYMGFDQDVQRALHNLAETPRTCLLLKTVVELDYAEIAQILGIPAGTAMSHVSRARAQMHELLAEAQPQALPARGVR